MNAPSVKICAVCHVPCDFLENEDGSDGRYVHAWQEFGTRNHVVVAVDPSEVAQISAKCDFCFSDNDINWTVVTTPFWMETFIPGATESTRLHYNALWAACDPCAELIKRRRWSQLVTRVANESAARKPMMGSREKSVVKASVAILYSKVEAHFVAIRERQDADPLDNTHLEKRYQ